MKKPLLVISLLLTNYLLSQQATYNMTGDVPISMTSLGSGTYNTTVFYHNLNAGLTIELAKLVNDINSTPIDFNINARGGLNPFFTLKGNNGNVGIGTTTPTSKLTVAGDIAYGEALSNTLTRDDAGAMGVGIKSGFYQTENPINYPAGATSWWHLLDVRHSNTNNNYAMQFSGYFGDQELWFRKTGNNANQPWRKVLMEQANGNVGIGTTTPSAKLDVNGGGVFKGGLSLLNSETKGASNLLISGNGGYIPAGIIFRDTSYTQSGQINDWAIWKGNEWLKGLGFMRYDAVNRCSSGICDLPLMLWDNGNISMGISQARIDIDAKLYVNDNLSVNAKLEAKEVKVTTTPTADFVFAEDYQLPKLETVEKHIKEKKHLPEIASAKEMEKEGVNVGEFQIKLLQKIEELTLYSIEQNKQIKKLQEENSDLRKQSERLGEIENRLKSIENQITK